MSIDWDAWRANHASMTFADNQQHHEEVYRLHPEQEHHHPEWVERFLADADPKTVAEIGGWRGELAAKMLAKFPSIESWANFDICRSAIVNSVVTDPRYEGVVLTDYLWNGGGVRADAFVAAHVIEHFTRDELAKLADILWVKDVYFEAPLLEPGQTWDGYIGNHINPMTWPEVHALMDTFGYELVHFSQYGDTGAAHYRVRIGLHIWRSLTTT